MTDNPTNSVPPASNEPGGYSQQGTGAPKTLSIISMIAGILGLVSSLFGFGIIASIGAVVLGHLGQRREKVAGRAFWITGLITGYIGVAIGLFVVVLLIIAFVAAGNDPSLQQQLG